MIENKVTIAQKLNSENSLWQKELTNLNCYVTWHSLYHFSAKFDLVHIIVSSYK